MSTELILGSLTFCIALFRLITENKEIRKLVNKVKKLKNDSNEEDDSDQR